ncbi:uncharacterized protein BYT42DRAFT_549052 [Radiomyces spectabilis]|uniref:uncharacterized protein n=1 Tax=Radiomyces spectabilis TaxID=64574 RepID=UPI00221ECDBA|nr:uncharacterized protein BYT42DRAFT_549052 [Radiomyces spectabilis]KAI8369344.1 hypothetical protein BYT42DRAFT_549052 [Radiomyces spectabilis]
MLWHRQAKKKNEFVNDGRAPDTTELLLGHTSESDHPTDTNDDEIREGVCGADLTSEDDVDNEESKDSEHNFCKDKKNENFKAVKDDRNLQKSLNNNMQRTNSREKEKL